jgi:hypothetical protein
LGLKYGVWQYLKHPLPLVKTEDDDEVLPPSAAIETDAKATTVEDYGVLHSDDP